MFSKKTIGLSINDESIEAVELERKGNKMKVLKISKIDLDFDIVKKGRIKNEEKLIQAVKSLFKQARPKSIVADKIIFSLPKDQVNIKILELNITTEKDLIHMVEEEAEKNIFFNKENLIFSYKLLDKAKDSVEILLITTNKEVILEWQYFFKKLGINLDFFDIEELAMFRGLTEKPNRPICLINIDKTDVNISIFDNKGLHYYKSINNIDLNSEEIKASIDYFKNKTGQRIKNIILVGNTDLGKKITSELNLNTFIGKSVLYKANLSEKYIISIGVAFKGLDKRWDRDPSFSLQKIDKEPKKQEVEIIESIVKEKKPKKKIKLKILFFVILIIIILLVILFFEPKDNQEEQEIDQEIDLPVEEQEIIEKY